MLNGVSYPVKISIVSLPILRKAAREQLARDFRKQEAQGRMPYGTAQSTEFLNVVMNNYPAPNLMRQIKAKSRRGYSVVAEITVDHVGDEVGSHFTVSRTVEFMRKNALARTKKVTN